MRVNWTVIHTPLGADDYAESYFPTQPLQLRGEVLGVVRTFGQTKLVVMLDEGRVTEIEIQFVKREVELAQPGKLINQALEGKETNG